MSSVTRHGMPITTQIQQSGSGGGGIVAPRSLLTGRRQKVDAPTLHSTVVSMTSE
jgi:hypothetical protein